MAKLSDYLKDTGQSQSCFAAKVGTTQGTVSRLCAGQVPKPDLLARIVAETRGAVQPNDFYGI